MLFDKKIKVGLALGGGGSKGLAHIGVIKVLEKYLIPIDYITGCSAGALIGGFYAAKKDIQNIENIALNYNWPQILPLFFDFSISKGLIRGGKIKDFIEKNIGLIRFDELKIPFAAIATDLYSAAVIQLDKGNVAEAIRASISFPLLFKPVEIENKLLVDGGLSVPVPCQQTRQMGADFVIAINLGEDFSGTVDYKKIGIKHITDKTVDILSHYLARENVKYADVVICPKVGKIGLFDRFMTARGTQEVISLGEKATEESIPQIRELLDQRKKNIFSRVIKHLFNN